MAQDADEATQALIAQMLAEDNPYADYGDRDDDSGSDYSDYGKKKKPKKGGKAKAAPKPKVAKVAKEAKAAAGGEELSATGRKKRKDTGAPRQAARAWTEEEERLFVEALKLHGRDWKKCAEHVGTRDARSFTSHAQKYFIKMCLQGRPLPAKVRETGDGYTLSGKPLDPNSAAAKAYGFKPSSLEELKEITNGEGLAGLMDLGEKENEAEENIPADIPTAAVAPVEETPPKAAVQPPAKRAKKEAAAKSPPPPPPPDTAEAPQPTEYQLNRPRRERKGPQLSFRSGTGTLDLTPCCMFSTCPGDRNAQPFKVTVTPSVLAIMDLHAHLCSNEVIGFLGGKVDSEAKSICIQQVFPGRGQASGLDVEMDPIAEVEMRSEVEASGLSVVGWYHSHPVFAPHPSGVDINNQINYQTLFRDKASGLEPFIAFIVGPYDLRLPTQSSKIQTFCVQSRYGEPTPLQVNYNVVGTSDTVGDPLLEAVRKLVESQKGVEKRVNLTELWRPFTAMGADGNVVGGPVTKLAKLRASLREHLAVSIPSEDDVEDFLDRVATSIQTSWGVDLGY